MTANLKPCPFCGGDKLIICKTDFGFEEQTVYAVSCRYPECHGGIYALSHGNFETKDEAIAAWNTRAETAEAKLAKAVKLIDAFNYEL